MPMRLIYIWPVFSTIIKNTKKPLNGSKNWMLPDLCPTNQLNIILSQVTVILWKRITRKHVCISSQLKMWTPNTQLLPFIITRISRTCKKITKLHSMDSFACAKMRLLPLLFHTTSRKFIFFKKSMTK